jgi:peptide/nickel transport system substrate-binding protein
VSAGRARRRVVGVAALLAVVAAGCSPTARDAEPLVTTPDAVAPGIGVVDTPAYEPPHDRPGPAADRIRFRSFHVDRAALELGAGNMDLYLFSLKTVAAERLRDNPDVLIYPAPATTLSLVLNPAPAPEGQLNPFSIQEIRQAMQQLVDRDFIARDLFLGLAAPMVTHVSPFDFDFLTVHDIARSPAARHDPELARSRIAAAMLDAGAELVDGVWHYAGRPVRLRFVARVEDERREISDLVRAELERAGFPVAISYQPFAPAVLQVYATDPQAFEWHLYTEGWGRGAATRYDFGTVNQMTAPWLGNMPGWREVGFWQYEHAELDDLGQRLFRGEFAGLDERNEIYREMTRLALDESVRIWLATAVNHFPARADLVGVSRDPVAGPRGPWTLREAYLPGQDELTVGHLWVWTERTTWNPVGGFGDVYSVDVFRNLHDPPLWNHPFTGIPMSFRADFEVETAGPSGTLAVPADAVMWDATANRWQQVGPGTTAVSRVVLDYSRYVDAVWHHGEPITMADVLYPIAQAHELAYDPEKARIEVALAVTARPYLETFRGYRVLDDRRLEVYVDYWHFEENHIAAYASPASLSMPWEVLAAMDALVFGERRAAYSDTAAARFNVPWISLVMERDARLVQRSLRGLLDAAAVPDGVFDVGGQRVVDAGAAAGRYRAALDWFDEYGHLVIGNGPFMLTRYDPPAQLAELEAFRHESYPFRPGDWYFGEPPVVRIADVEVPAMQAGEEGEVTLAVTGPGTLGVQYLLIDAGTGEVAASGAARRVADDRFVVLLPALPAGLYRLELAAHSDQVAVLGERRVDVEVR